MERGRDTTPAEGSALEVVRAVVRLWWAGLKEACCFHRLLLFVSSRVVARKTLFCFFLNSVFLASIFFLEGVLVPSLRWLLGASPPNATLTAAFRAGSLLQTLAYVSYTVFFLYPVYVVTFVINSLWYTDIANHAVKALRDTPLPPPTRRQWWGVGFLQGTLNRLFKGQEGRNEGPTRGGEATESLYPKIESVPSVPASQVSGSDSGSGSSPLEAKLQPLGERVFALLMLTDFSAQMALVGCIPVVGQPITFWLLSWLYGYYCFDYRWGFDGWTLDQRLLYFERNWPFFAGFGTPCVAATFFLPTLVSAGVGSILFPLFVLLATASHTDGAIAAAEGGVRVASLVPPVPVFGLARAQA